MSDWYWDNPPRHGQGSWSDRLGPCTLPGAVDARPGHRPSAVTFCAPSEPVRLGMAGGRADRWVRIARVECECGWAYGRSQTVTSLTKDDIGTRAVHTSHSLRQPKAAA